jgi:hypothetical protein
MRREHRKGRLQLLSHKEGEGLVNGLWNPLDQQVLGENVPGIVGDLWFRRPTLKAVAKDRGFSNFSLVSPLERSILTLAEGLAGKFAEKSDPASIEVDARADCSHVISSCNIRVPILIPSYTHSCPTCSLTTVSPSSA